MKTDSRFELNSPLETYEISGFMYHTYHLEVWFGRFGLHNYKKEKC